MTAASTGQGASTGKELIQSAVVAQGLQAIDQVRAAAAALNSVGVPLQVSASGAELQRRYDQWGELSLQRLGGASELLNNVRTSLEQARAHADSTAGQLSAAWPDTAGQAAYANYQAAAARANTDFRKVGQFSRALDQYQESVVKMLTDLREQAEGLSSNLLGSLGQYRTTDSIVQAVQQIQSAMNQRPAAPNAQSLVDALRQQLKSQVAVPTEFAATMFQRLLSMIEQQASSSTELLASTLRDVNVDPYKVPEFPITCEPDRPDDCGCEGKEQQDQTAASGESAAAASAADQAGDQAAAAAATAAPAAAGTPAAATAPAAGGGAPSGGGTGGGSSGKGGSSDDSADGGGAGDGASGGDSGGSAPDMGFLGDIAGAIGDTISGLAGAAGQLGSGLAGAAGSGLGAIGDALSGTDFSGFTKDGGTDAAKSADEAADEDASLDGAADLYDDGSADVGADLDGDGIPDSDVALDGSAAAPDGSVSLSPEGSATAPEGAVIAQPGGGGGLYAAGGGGQADPVVVPARQGDHGEFEVESNELQVPIVQEDSAPAPQVCAVPATTPISVAPSAIPSF
ncbi:hypothetical protein [Segniliparus rugosus]|uniref:Uncharacterized protein n=1 Tax=Segniliparus rugosus (strain ATCC BAA-974 / DSM 45345 / CCUG 50838 / CIP 108380 / JCM 13579 / CDC 945) TaxID=679197 RepID=U1M1K2_SEGRC|nr:hypothetical protein [Segniliparus rugosus]ERG69257.1 hypothetical protein HMPREF9336_04148 [Segniliparus rugosus ATCC BAA-974]